MRILAAVGITLLLVGCGSIKPDAPEVVVTKSDSTWTQPVSQISVPIRIDLTPYFEQTNTEIPTEFKGKEDNCDGVSFAYEFKRSPIQFEGKGKDLHYSVDGKYALHLSYCPQCTEVFNEDGNCIIPRIYASCGVNEPMRKIHVAYKTEIGLTPNYSLISKTELQSVEALSPCKITVFKYNATKTIEEEVTKALQALELDIDKEISSISLQQELTDVWNALKEPVDLEGFGYFSIQPRNISLSDLVYNGKFVDMTALLSAYPTVQLDKPETDTTSLPKLCEYTSKDGFNVTVDVKASYDSLNAILNRSLSGQKMNLKKKEIIFDSVSVLGAIDKRISLKVNFSGSKRGIIYLQGTPEIDTNKQIVSIPDLEFDLETKHVLLRSAKWIFDKKITEKVRQSAIIDLNPYLDTLKISIVASLNGEIEEGVNMSGSLAIISLKAIHPREKDLFIRAKATGKLKVSM